MVSDGMTVRLHLKRIRVVRVVEDEINRLVVEVADTRKVVRCPSCGFKTSKVHETRRVQIQDLPWGRPTTLVWQQRRFECDNCGQRHTEDHPEFEGKLTRRLARSIVTDSRHLTIRELSRPLWPVVAFRDGPGPVLVRPGRPAPPPGSMSGVARSLRRRHRYVTVLVDGESGAVLGMVRHRDAKALSSFFVAQGHRWCRRVRVVVSDGSESYRAAIGRHLGHATHVLDRFGVARWFAQGLIEVGRRRFRLGDLP